MEDLIAEIERKATEAVDDRLTLYEAALPRNKASIALMGAWTMGLITKPRDQQIKSYGLYLLSEALPDEQWRDRDPGAPR